jgi:methionyl-tRNA formyltransferase
MADSFRLILIGQAAFGESVLNGLLDQGEQIVGVFAPPDKPGKPVDPIKAAAEKRGLPVFQFARLRAPEAIEAVKSLGADLGVMAFVTDIVPDAVLRAPRLSTIQYHPSLLPKHRGPSSINWPIIQGETETGLSIFWPDAGLDTGPILMQRRVTIGPDDTLGTVYFDRLFPMGVEAMAESVRLVKAGKAPKTPQSENGVSYEGWCRAENCVVDWKQPAQNVHNLIRGSDPSPGASSTFDGAPLGVFASRMSDERGNRVPGEIVKIGPEGIHVACAEGAVCVGKVRASGKKLGASEWAQHAGIAPGTRIGTD